MIVDCSTCVMQHTDVCNDCIVTFLLDRPAGAVVFDVAEERAIRTLQAEGLAPTCRFVGGAQSSEEGLVAEAG